MSENRSSWLFLITAILAVAWGLYLKINQPKEPEEAIRWVYSGEKLVNSETREPFQGARKLDFELNPGVAQFEFNYIDGIRQGDAKEFYPGFGNRVKRHSTYVDGVEQGPVTKFYPNGAKSSVGIAVDDNIHGMVTYYGENGLVTGREVYDHGDHTDTPAITVTLTLTEEPPPPFDPDNPEEEPPPPRWLDAEGHPYTGTQTGTFHSGVKAYERPFTEGRKHGLHRSWHADGSMEQERGFADGQPHGNWKTWAETGQLLSNETFHYGQQVGASRRYFSDGKPRLETTFVHGVENGNRVEFAPDGTKKRTITFDHGRQIKVTDWSPDGTATEELETPLPVGLGLTIPASDAATTETVELPAAEEPLPPAQDFNLIYRLSTSDEDSPHDITRTFQITIFQGEKKVVHDEVEAGPGGWQEKAWLLFPEPGQPISVQVQAQPGDLQIDLAGIATSD